VTRSVRVAVVVDSDAFGGAEVWTCRELEHLPAGIRPSLLVTRPVADRLGVPDRVERRTVIPLARRRGAAPEVAAALAEIAPDVVHVNLVDPASNRAALDAALDRAPTVAALHLQGQLVALGVPAQRCRRLCTSAC
jgi:hypothetical protein